MDRCSEYDPFRESASAPSASALEQKSIHELFSDFYTERGGGVFPDEKDLELLSWIEETTHHADVHGVPTETEIEKALEFVAKQEAEE